MLGDDRAGQRLVGGVADDRGEGRAELCSYGVQRVLVPGDADDVPPPAATRAAAVAQP